MQIHKTVFLLGCCCATVLAATSVVSSQDTKSPVQKAPRKIGGFYCIDLRPYSNDTTFDLYQIGWWTCSGFSQDIWKRHGVPFWYPRGLGDVFVAGPNWGPPRRTVISSAESGATARADHQQPGNGEIACANDDNLATYWYAGDQRPHGRLWIDLKQTESLSSVRFFGFATGRHAPKDYRVGVILSDGTEMEIAAVKDETRMGQWISFDAHDVRAKCIYLDVASTVENEHGPVIHEFQARVAAPVPVTKTQTWPSEVVIPLSGVGAEELFVLGNVGMDLNRPSKAGATVGRYVVTYESGDEDVIPLVVGRNVADVRYGHFVPEAQAAFMMPVSFSPDSDETLPLSYHLDEMLPVEPKQQLMKFEHPLAQPGQPLKSLTFQATDPEAGLYLAAVTIRQSGPRMNALFYNGKLVTPVPEGTPEVAPSILDTRRDESTTLSLDGVWRYRTDPGNEGVRGQFFAEGHDVSAWNSMPVPSQWYVQGLDYHGVVWFRRELSVPVDFPGSVMELCFGGVDYDARVWVNGQYVGRHIGAYSAFTLDVTAALRKGKKNSIVVRVDSPLDPGFTGRKTLPKGNAMEDIAMPYAEEGCMGGIYRPVRLEGRGDVGIEDAWTRVALTNDLQQAEVTIQCVLCPKEPKPEELTVRCTLRQQDGDKAHGVEVQQRLTTDAQTPVTLKLTMDQPRLWYPWEQGNPYLYLMEIEVWRGKQLLDRNVSRVGIREVGFDAKTRCVLINHHRIFLKGFLNDDLHWMSLMNRSGYSQRLRMQKDANVNTIRIVTHQSSPEMYDLCNEMGFLVWQELPLQWGYSPSEPHPQGYPPSDA